MKLSAVEPSTNGRVIADYEAMQIQQIADWKRRLPSRLSVVVDTVTSPLTWVVGHFIPRSLVNRVVNSLETVASKSDSGREVACCFKAASVDEIAKRPLAECDAWSKRFSARAERFAIVEGTALSFAGPFVHIPCQLIASLLAITRIGHCYGYSLERRIDQAIIIDILEISMLENPELRTAMIETLHNAIDEHASVIPGEADLVARTSRTLIAEEAVDIIPVVGTAVAFLFDGLFMHSVDETARRIFQERWLRDHGRVQAIAPSSVAIRKSSLEEVGLVLGQTLYCTGAILGFAVTFPGAAVQKLVGRRPNPVSRGARHGADRAVNDAREFVTGLKNAHEDDFEAALAVEAALSLPAGASS